MIRIKHYKPHCKGPPQSGMRAVAAKADPTGPDVPMRTIATIVRGPLSHAAVAKILALSDRWRFGTIGAVPLGSGRVTRA
jgi:hypothetical protein